MAADESTNTFQRAPTPPCGEYNDCRNVHRCKGQNMICGRYYEYATDRKLKTKMNMYIPRANLYQKLFSRSEAE